MTARFRKTIKIASYNIRKAKGTDRRRDPDRIFDVIQSLAADIVVLQEADMRLGDRPSALPLRHVRPQTRLKVIGLAVNDVSIGWHGNAVLVRPEATALRARRINLPGLEPRGAAIVDLAIGGRELRILGTHLGLLRSSRRQQLSYLLDFLFSLPPLPTVLMGDFNEWSLRVGLGRLAKHYTVLSPGKTYHALRPVAHLDRFAFSDALAVKNMGVMHDSITRKASDHLPIWADFQIRD